MKTIDDHYKDWCGEHHTTNSAHPVHDSAEACDFAEYYFKEKSKGLETQALNTPVFRRSFKFDYKFGHLSKEGYRHFPIIYFAYGTNGFSLCILGVTITVKLW